MSTNLFASAHRKTYQAEAGDSFVDAVFACLLMAALPVKNVAYLTPFVFVGLQIWAGNFGFLGRVLLWGGIAFCLSTLSITIDSLSGQVVNPPGLVFGVMTYSTLGVMLGLRSDFTMSTHRWRSLRTAVAWFVLIQSAIGMLQFAACGDPDAVCGTFGLFDFLGGITIAQVYLTFNLFAMVAFLMTDQRDRLENIAIGAGLVACLLAHSGHQTLFFMGALAVVAFLQMSLRDLVKLGAALGVLVALTVSLSTIESGDIAEWKRKVAQEEDSPKRMVTLAAAKIMSEPKNLLLGVGMGQFTSRAALISSGSYLATELPRSLTGESEYYRSFVIPARNEYLDNGEDSAMSQPSYSNLNLLVEFGIPLALLLLYGAAMQFYRNWRLARSPNAHARAVGLWANVGLVFFVLCCFIENYMEFPQAIFLPALLYVAALASAKQYDNSPRRSPRSKRNTLAGGRDA